MARRVRNPNRRRNPWPKPVMVRLFNGRIWAVTMYDHALTVQEIMAAFQRSAI